MENLLMCPNKQKIYQLLGHTEGRALLCMRAGKVCAKAFLDGDLPVFRRYFEQAYASLSFPYEWSYFEAVQEDTTKWERLMIYLFGHPLDKHPDVEICESYATVYTLLGKIEVPFILRKTHGGQVTYHAYYVRRSSNKDYISSSSRVRKAERKTENNPILAAIKYAMDTRYPELVVHCIGLSSCEDSLLGLVDINPSKDDCFHSFGEWSGRREEFAAFIMEQASKTLELKDCSACRFQNTYCMYVKDLAGETQTTEQTKEKTLTKEQQKAVHAGGTILLSACPGSGKTTVMVERIRRLINEGIPAGSILALTFSNAAANNLRARVENEEVMVSTFHSFCYHILEMFYEDLCVATERERYRLINEILQYKHPQGISSSNLYAERSGSVVRIDKILTELSKGTEKISYGSLDEEEMKELYEIYETIRKERNIFTYDELLIKAKELLIDRPGILRLVKKEYPHILVDEYQDIDQIQFEVLSLIKGEDFFVVGDADQTIYEFRKASNTYMLKFTELFPEGQVLYLTENFRSTSEICQTAENLISYNQDRLSSALTSVTGANGHPTRFCDGFDLSTMLKPMLNEFVREGYLLGDIAIIARTNAECAKVVTELGISHARRNRTVMVDDPVFRTIHAILSLYEDPEDKEAELTLNLLHTGQELGSIGEDTRDMAVWEVIEGILDSLSADSDVTEVCHEALQKLYGRETYAPLSEILLLMEQAQVKTLFGAFRMMDQMIEMRDDSRVTYPRDPKRVTVLTAHDSKGLEFPVVIIIGLENFSEVSEAERRLLYVACTRAEQQLVICQGTGKVPYYEELQVSREEVAARRERSS